MLSCQVTLNDISMIFPNGNSFIKSKTNLANYLEHDIAISCHHSFALLPFSTILVGNVIEIKL